MPSVRDFANAGFFRSHCGCVKIGLALVSLGCLTISPTKADYLLGPGDVIEISVGSVPELQRRVSVQMHGSIIYPSLGAVIIAGMSPAEAHDKIRSILATKVLRQRGSDGKEIFVTVDPDDVAVAVVEYRPIYVNGDVSSPGEHAYRPLMTVRQAVALAGGYEVRRWGRIDNPFLAAIDLRADFDSLKVEIAKEQARQWRVKTELGKNDADQRIPLTGNAPNSLSTLIAGLELDQMTERQADYQKEKTFMRHAIDQANQRIKSLSEQEGKEQQNLQADTDDLQKIYDLHSKGFVPNPRLTETRRSVLLSSTRLLQTTAQLMQVQAQQDELVRKLQKLDSDRKINLARELQETTVRLGELQAKLQSVGTKLQIAAAMSSQLDRGEANKPDIAIVRKSRSGRDRIVADEDAELQPGDVVKITVKYRSGNFGTQ